jgi:hypothetical protein
VYLLVIGEEGRRDGTADLQVDVSALLAAIAQLDPICSADQSVCAWGCMDEG